MRHKVSKGRDRKVFKLTAGRTRRENLTHRIVPRGGTRH